MRMWGALVFAGLTVLSCAARADDARAPVPTNATPWVDDLALIKQAEADVQTGGILAIEGHRERLEQALAGGRHSMDLAAAARPTSYVLTDGPAEALGALLLATTNKHPGVTNTVAVENPYPAISFYLASYYDEMNKPQDALRVLDTGLMLTAMPDLDAGEMRAVILVERGSALMALRRWQDVLQNEDRGLKMNNLDNKIRAHLYRGRGYALGELNQLDDAEAAYKESLNLEPGNPTAENELRYIAGLKHGALPGEPGVLNKVQKSSPAEGAPATNP